MVFDATFWVAISFIIFFGVLIYLKVPLKINESLNKLIADIKNELNESEKLRKETKAFLDQSQSKLNSASDETKVIIENAKKDADAMVQQMKEKFNKSVEIKKRLTAEKINQMKDQAIIPNQQLAILFGNVYRKENNSQPLCTIPSASSSRLTLLIFGLTSVFSLLDLQIFRLAFILTNL